MALALVASLAGLGAACGDSDQGADPASDAAVPTDGATQPASDSGSSDAPADQQPPPDSRPGDAQHDQDAGPEIFGPMNLHFNSPPVAAIRANGAWYVGGSFTVADAISAPRAIALSLAGAASTPCKLDSGFGVTVSSMLEVGTSVYIAGAFTTYRGQPANRIVKLDATTCAMDTTFSPSASNGFNGQVRALASDGTSLYATGDFTAYRGVVDSAHYVAKLNATTGAIDTAFTPVGTTANGFDNIGVAIAVSGTSVYVGGTFSAYKGVANSARNIAKLDTTTGALDVTFSPPGTNGFDAQVGALAVSGTSLYVGGEFSAYRGVANSARKLAKLALSNGAIDTSFSPVGATANGFENRVFAIAASASAVYVGGWFSAYRGVADSARFIAKLDPTNGTIDTTFSPPGATTNGFNANASVLALQLSGTSLYVGGGFTAYRGASTVNNIAKLDAASGALDTTFLAPGSTRPGFWGGGVTALHVGASTLWAGGDFRLYGGKSANFIAKFDQVTGAFDSTFSPALNGFDSTVNAFAASGNALYVGGEFRAYRGVATSANRIAKLDLVTGAIDTTFNPPGATSNGFDGAVYSFATTPTSLYVGGTFSAYRGVANTARAVAKLDLVTGAIDATFSPPGATANGFNGDVSALAVMGTSLFAAGSFQSYRGVPDSANNVAKLDLTNGALDTTFSPPGATSNGFDSDVYALVAHGGSLFVGGDFEQYRGVASSARRVAKLDGTSGALDTTFSPPGATSNGFEDAVYALDVIGSSLFAGGDFTEYKGAASSANYMAKLDVATGALDSVFTPSGPTTAAPVYLMRGAGPLVFVGGQFFGCKSGTCGTNAFRLNATTGQPE